MPTRSPSPAVPKQTVLAELAELTAMRRGAAALSEGGDPAAAARAKRQYNAKVSIFLAKHVGLAKQFAKKYARKDVEREELEAAAMRGQWDAVERWDPEKATCWTSFAYSRMRYSVQAVLFAETPLVRAPYKAHQDQSRIRRVQQTRPDEQLSDEQLAAGAGLPLQRARAARELQERQGNIRYPSSLSSIDVQVSRNLTAHEVEEAMCDRIDASRTAAVEPVFSAIKAELQAARPRKRRLGPGSFGMAALLLAGAGGAR